MDDDCTGWIMLLMRAHSMVHSEKYVRPLSVGPDLSGTRCDRLALGREEKRQVRLGSLRIGRQRLPRHG